MNVSISKVPERSVNYLRRDTTESRSAMPRNYTLSRTPEERFWTRVNRDGPVPEHVPHLGPCWLWTGAKISSQPSRDYGKFGLSGRSILAHRYSWELANGEPIPEGMMVCHHCDNPPCVRPSHLFLGANLDNIRDAIDKGRRASSAS